MKVSEDIVTRVFSGIDFEEILDYLIQEVKIRNYLITRVSNIDNIHDRLNLETNKNVGFKFYKIVEFCNLENCSQLISSNLLAGVFMPVKFIVYQPVAEEQIYISFLRPTSFAHLFNSKKMIRIAKILEQDMYEVLEEIVF